MGLRATFCLAEILRHRITVRLTRDFSPILITFRLNNTNDTIKLNPDIAHKYLRPETTPGYKLTYFNG